MTLTKINKALKKKKALLDRENISTIGTNIGMSQSGIYSYLRGEGTNINTAMKLLEEVNKIAVVKTKRLAKCL